MQITIDVPNNLPCPQVYAEKKDNKIILAFLCEDTIGLEPIISAVQSFAIESKFEGIYNKFLNEYGISDDKIVLGVEEF